MWMYAHSHGREIVLRVYNYLESIQPGLARKVFGGVVTSATLSYVSVRLYRYYCSWRIGKERGKAAREACQTLKEYLQQQEQEDGPVNKDREEMIVSLSFTDLKEKLWKGELKALEVLRAYQRKALEVNESINCITEPIFEAEALAVELDLMKPNQRKPLHGIPVSIKDCQDLEGYDNHGGFACLANKPAAKDADIVQLLKSLGAVPFVRTNFPQGLMSFACTNPMYGKTCNPHNPNRTPGGSSGGEGALIGGGGSVIGIGSDIGGSIRIPGQMCGVYGLKPCVDRIVNRGEMSSSSGQTLVRPTVGPMARDMDGLIQFSQELLTPRMHNMDPYVPPLHFRDELFEKKGPLNVGIFTEIEFTKTHPACVRAVMEAKAALEQKGYKVLEFKPPRAFDTMCELYLKACFGDDGEEDHLYLKNDVVDECMSVTYYAGQLPSSLRYMIFKLISLVDRPFGKMGMALSSPPKKITDWWHLQDEIKAYQIEFFEVWKSHKLDALICPGLPFPAPTSGKEDFFLAAATFTTLYNLLNYPAGILPVTTVTEKDIMQVRNPSIYPLCGPFEKAVVKDSEGTLGLPVAVQCVSLPYHEEMVLRIMKDIDSVTKKN